MESVFGKLLEKMTSESTPAIEPQENETVSKRRKGQIKINGTVYDNPALSYELIEELKEQYSELVPHLCRTCGVVDCKRYRSLSNEDIEEGLTSSNDIYITKCRAYKRKTRIYENVGKYEEVLQHHITDPGVYHNIHKL
ncbi:MAG: hypothetical protein IKF82_02210 [Bacilli bacterium]|nr:hypothetical protein [Bacilli bacterium]